MKRKSHLKFPDGFEIAFYDVEHTRITPWFDANAAYTGTPETADKPVRSLAVRTGNDCEHLSVHDYRVTIVDGATHAAEPSEQLVNELTRKLARVSGSCPVCGDEPPNGFTCNFCTAGSEART